MADSQREMAVYPQEVMEVEEDTKLAGKNGEVVEEVYRHRPTVHFRRLELGKLSKDYDALADA